MSSISRKVPATELTTLTKADFESYLIEKTSVDSQVARSLSEGIISIFSTALKEKKSILMARVGTLDVTKKNARPGRNPKTLEPYMIDARYSVTLRTSSKNEHRLQKPQLLQLLKEKIVHVSDDVIRATVIQFMNFVRQIEDGKNRVEIRGLGVFYPSVLPERKARNPKTGEQVIAAEKVVIRFKCSKLIVDSLNK